MLSDPQAITIDGTAISLPRITNGDLSSQYSDPSGSTKLRVSHTIANRDRGLVRLDLSKVGVDPLLSTVSRTYTASVYLVIDRPLNGAGFTNAELEKAIKGFTTYLAATGFMPKILGYES